MRKVLILCFFILLLVSQTADALTVKGLKINAVINPQCIEDQPCFSWIICSSEIDVYQTAYKITLYTDSNREDVCYESDIIPSSQSIDVKLNNLHLQPTTRYYWQVEIWDNHGNSVTSDEFTYFDTGLMNTGFKGAMWIKGEDGEGVPYFRKSFSVSKKIKKAMLYSSSLGLYEIFVNGKRCPVLNKSGEAEYDILKPGNTEYNKRVFYNGHDITTLLDDEGENVIGAIVTSGWWNGRIAYRKYGNKENAFICKCIISYEDNSTDTIVSDLTWHYSKKMSLRSSDIYDGEIYDARLDDNWNHPNYDASSWTHVEQSSDFIGTIEPYKGPIVKEAKELSLKPVKTIVYKENQATGTDYGIVNVISQYFQPSKIEINPEEHVVFDFGQNHSGWIHFKVKGDVGTTIHLQFSEMLNDNGSLARYNDGPGGSLYLANLRTAKAEIYYTCSGKPDGDSYTPLASYYGYRYCCITSKERVEIDSVVSIPITSTPALVSELETDNNLVNQLFSNIKWGQRSNYISIPTDCPQRDERLGWLADTQLFCRTGMYNDDARSFFQKWMHDLRDSQMEDGSIPSTAPVIYYHYAGGWSDAAIIVPWQTYLMYGDTTIVADNFGSMIRYMDWLSTRHDGDIKFAGADINFGDWLAPDSTNRRYVSMAYYALDAQLMAKMAKIISKDKPYYRDLGETYEILYGNIRDEIQKFFFKDGIPVQSTQTTYLLALAFKLFQDEEQRDRLIEGLDKLILDNEEILTTGFIGTALLNTTLSKYGLSDRAYGLLKQRKCPSWLYSIDQGATTMWERWDSYTKERGFGDKGMNSFNHYAYGAVGEWMYRYMLGIEVDENAPGFKHIILQPHPDTAELSIEESRILNCRGIYDSQYGRISVLWNVDNNNQLNYNVSLPANTTALLYFPVESDDIRVTVKNSQGGSEGIDFIGYEKGNFIYSLKSGVYYLSSSIQTSVREIGIDEKSSSIMIDKGIIRTIEPFASIVIFDITGKMIAKSKAGMIDMNCYPKGIYLINIKTENNTESFKFTKG